MSSDANTNVCHKESAPESPPSLFQNGNIVFQTHHVGWIVAGCFTIAATVTSIWLVSKHLQWYTNKREQRYIVRLLFMVPLYALISLASYLWWNHATPLILIRDGYESTVLTAFFYLLLMYLSPDNEEQKRIFLKNGLSRQNDLECLKKGDQPKKWVFPLGFVKWKPADGLYFLQLMKWGVLQYCVIRPVTTLIAVILDYAGLYCESSWGLGWGHIYIVIVVSISVTIAMYCLIQLYVTVSRELAKHKPLLKLFAIKAVVFLTFWQATFLSVLSMFGVVKDTKYMTADDINIGIGALIETFEMMLFAFLHIKAFTYKVYRPFYDPESDFLPPEPTPRLRSLKHAMDFRETLRELWIGCVYIWDKFRGREPTPDVSALRTAHYQKAFGKQRPSQTPPNPPDIDNQGSILEKPTLPSVQVEIEEKVEVDIAGEKQWLGVGDDYGYGLDFFRRERSEGLEEQIEHELKKRGYTLRKETSGTEGPAQRKHGKQRSWWRSIYNRISQSGNEDHEEGIAALSHSRSKTRKHSQSKHVSRDRDAVKRLLPRTEIDMFDLEDQPPSSIFRKDRSEVQRAVDKWRQSVDPEYGSEDVLMPLSTHIQTQRKQSNNVRRAYTSSTNNVGNHPTEHSSPLRRLFPLTEHDHSTEQGHVTDSAQSLISASDGYKLPRNTPKASLIPVRSTVIPREMIQARSATVHQVPLYSSMAADIVGPTPGQHMMTPETRVPALTKPAGSGTLHRRERADSQWLDQKPSNSVVAPPSSPPYSPGLRRSSAQYRSPKYPPPGRTPVSPTVSEYSTHPMNTISSKG